MCPFGARSVRATTNGSELTRARKTFLTVYSFVYVSGRDEAPGAGEPVRVLVLGGLIKSIIPGELILSAQLAISGALAASAVMAVLSMR